MKEWDKEGRKGEEDKKRKEENIVTCRAVTG
jgi:hypothetical protein